MLNFTRTNKIVILIIAIVITTTIGVKILISDSSKAIEIDDNELFSEIEEIKKEDSEEQGVSEQMSEEVVVHITGEVSRPGIVTLKNGSRVIDAISEAGGLTPSADQSNINLAQKLFDEDKIIIPRVGDGINLEGFALGGLEQEQSTQDIVISRNGASSSATSNSGGLININTASKEELKTLSGIGDVTADKIIDYRESTKFSSIEDIKNVSGIGDKKFEAIKAMITIRWWGVYNDKTI